MAQATLAFTRTLFQFGLGSRGARAELPGTVDLDASKCPANVNDLIYWYGADMLLRQASQIAEKAQIKDWVAKNPDKDVPLASKFPWDLKRLREEALAAMQAHVKAWYTGDLGRDGLPMNAIERRAATLIQAALTRQYAEKGHAQPEDWGPLVAQVLAHPEKGPKFRAQAEAAFAAERAAVEAAGNDLADLLPQPKKASKA